MPAGLASLMKERIFVPKTPFSLARLGSIAQVGYWLHGLDTVGLLGEALVHLQERHDGASPSRDSRLTGCPSVRGSSCPQTRWRRGWSPLKLGTGDDPRTQTGA